MARAILASLVLIATQSFAAQAGAAPVLIAGGGAASQDFNYAAPDVNGMPVSEYGLFAALQSEAAFDTYWSTTSGVAQTGLLTDDLTCLTNRVQGVNGGNCSATMIGGANTVHYAVAESVLTPTQTSYWATASTGQVQAGNLIQLPMLGTGLAIVVNMPGETANGQVVLSDTDLCGIFSGKITDFSQIQDSPAPLRASPITVLYRSDSAGTTFLLTNHLSAVCTTANANIRFTATSSWTTLFPSGFPANFIGISGLSTLANTLAGLTPTAYPSAVSFISPDWTSLDSATSTAKLSNNMPSPLFVAALRNGPRTYLPTSANITTGLTHPKQGQTLSPPANAAAAANPSNWVPVIQTTAVGYPIVGYSTFDLPQCYANPAIASGMIAFLTDHYRNSGFLKVEQNNGLAAPANTAGARFVQSVVANILVNHNHWNVNIENAMACNGHAGR